ncbi:MAG: ABC transporter ATP-binding protein [Anaerolineales bacterium]|nr:ABC transporter ATP-binding protein [Anaerolineales bacterium]
MPTTVLQTENLTKHYGSLAAVKGLNLEIQRGEIFGLLGPNGAGKTTSINLMCGLLKPDTGRVFIHGKPVNGGDVEIRARIGVCPQNTILWGKLTCLEQLEFIGEMYGMKRRDARQRGHELLEIMGLAEKRNRLASTLSGGMQRRLNIILALVHDPDILVLDEPEAGLDPQSRVLVREYIREWALQRNRTVILTTHNMDEADRMAQRVAIMDHGELLVLDTPEALKRKVGEGDVLEIDLDGDQGLPPKNGLEAVIRLAPQTSLVGRTLVIRAKAAVDLLAAITEILRAAGFQPGEIRLRENTLEDVFIALTGRRLRE